MVIVNPSDAIQFKAMLAKITEYNGPVYFRVSKSDLPDIYTEPQDFEIGKGVVLEKGSDITIIATGAVVSRAYEALELLKVQGINATLIDMHTIKLIDKDIISEHAMKTKAVLVVEEHNKYGGLYRAVSEHLSETNPTKIGFVGINDFFNITGSHEGLLDSAGITAQEIAIKADSMVKEKSNDD